MGEQPASIFHELAVELIDVLQLWSLGPNSKPPFVSPEKAAPLDADPSSDGRLDAVAECITEWLAANPPFTKPDGFTRRLAQRVIEKLKALDTQPSGMPAETVRRQCMADMLQAEFQA